MTAATFASNHKIKFSPDLIAACTFAIDRMRHSRDPLHDHTHIQRMMSDLNQFYLDHPRIFSHLNLESLVLSIHWHDIWRSFRRPPQSTSLLFDNLYEGFGSYLYFIRHIRKFSLPTSTVRKTAYAIRKHSLFQFLPRLGPESKLLKDLDRLEIWSPQRITNFIGDYSNIPHIHPRLIKAADIVFRHWMLNPKRQKFYYPWSQKQFVLRRQFFLTQAYRVLSRHYPVYADKYSSLISSFTSPS